MLASFERLDPVRGRVVHEVFHEQVLRCRRLSRFMGRCRICCVTPRPVPASAHSEDARNRTMQHERCRGAPSPIAGYLLLDIHLHSFMM